MEPTWFDGGPVLLLIPESGRDDWHGAEETGVDHSRFWLPRGKIWLPRRSQSDYARACDSACEWIAPLKAGARVGYVLGGDVGMALVDYYDGICRIIRCFGADDEEDFLDSARREEHVVHSAPAIEFANLESNWLLMNAAYDGRECGDDCTPVTLPLGRLRIATKYLECRTHSGAVHRFSVVDP